jgi:CheY-like chemotaxis protein
MRILFVENHSVFAETVITEFLQNHGVTLVATCAEAQAAETESFDALLVDYDLDDGKGDAVVRRLRGSGFQGPIVAVSSHDDGNAALLAAGASVACRKSRFREVPALLQRLLADLANDDPVSDRPALHVGAVVSGTVYSVLPFGFFVRLGPDRYGLVRVVDIFDDSTQRPPPTPAVGTPVTCVVLHVESDSSGTRVSLSTKKSAVLAAQAEKSAT